MLYINLFNCFCFNHLGGVDIFRNLSVAIPGQYCPWVNAMDGHISSNDLTIPSLAFATSVLITYLRVCSLKGFEVRGTEISKRIRSHADLFEETLQTHTPLRSKDPIKLSVSTRLHQGHLATNSSYPTDDSDGYEYVVYPAMNESRGAAEAFFCDRPSELLLKD